MTSPSRTFVALSRDVSGLLGAITPTQLGGRGNGNDVELLRAVELQREELVRQQKALQLEKENLQADKEELIADKESFSSLNQSLATLKEASDKLNVELKEERTRRETVTTAFEGEKEALRESMGAEAKLAIELAAE